MADPLAESGVTMHSDSEHYSTGEESTNSPVILYKPPTVWSLVRGAAINLFLPFINGMMLGFGELFAHEAAFRLGWGGTKVWRTVGGSRQQFGTLGRVTSSPSLLSRTRQYAAPAAMGTIASTRNLSVWGYRIPYTGGSSEPKPVVPEPQPQTAAEASTTTAAEATPPAAPPSSAESFIPESGLSEISEMVNNPDFLNMPEGIGYLKSMGLDFGWGVTSTMGWVLEHVHIWGNLSWGGSIVATAVLLRVAFFWPFLKSTRFNHRMKLMQEDPRHVENTKKMQEAARSGDRQAQQEVFGLNKLLRQEYNAPISGILWGFLPIPFSIGFFRILNSMAKLPVPGMETGGFAWFQDLTVADPYYILPATATCFMVGTLVIGSRQSTAAQRAMMKKAGYVMVPIMFFVTSYLSAGVNLMGAAFGAATLVTTTMMSVNPIRRVFGVPDLRAPQPAIPTTATYEPPRPAPASPAYTPQGMKERLTTNYDDLKKTVGDGMSSMTGKYSETEADKAERKRKEMIKKIEAKRLDQEREHFNRKFKGGNK